ncbi:MAG: hypothetical protein K6F99_01505, partial [Lachnospiraceae bacterium]|nr:hypothetical protein [Lachnospiraceae bacterium]
EDFVSVVIKLYEEEFAPRIDELCESGIDRYTEYIAASAEMDDIRYQNEIDPGGPMEKNKSYKKYIPVLKSFIQKRKNFMDEILLENVKYVRIYLMNGEIEFDCINVKAGEKISPDGETPANEEGLSFAGWYDDEGNELKDGETAVSDKTYFARWE